MSAMDVSPKCVHKGLYDFPMGCIMRTHDNMSPFPLACPNWVDPADWTSTSCTDLEAYGRAGIVSCISDTVLCGLDHIKKSCSPHMSLLSSLEGANLKYSTSSAILATHGGSIKYDTIRDAVHLDIYTDGSGKDDKQYATWAFCVIGSDVHGNQTVHGGLFGKVTIDSTSIAFLGADCEDNSIAEISAQTFANLWLLQADSDISKVTSVCINFDSKFAAGIINGEMASRKYADIVSVSQGIFLQCQSKWHWSYQWVKGHSDHPWNELADTLCAWCRNAQALPVCNVPFDVCKDTGRELQLAFDFSVSGRSIDNISDLPSVEGSLNQERVSWQLPSSVISKWIDQHSQYSSHDIVKTCTLQVCQYNALSLIQCGAAKLLASQASKKRLHVVGIQESRYKKCRIFTLGPSLRVASGAPEGTLGCEIWFNMTLPFVRVNETDYYVDASSTTILHHEPRRLIVKCCCANRSFCSVSLHAPYIGKVDTDVDKWWSDTLDIINKYCPSGATIVFVDANLSIPSVCHTIRESSFGTVIWPNPIQVGRDEPFSQFLIESGVSAFGSNGSKLADSSLHSNITYVGKINNTGKTIDHILGKGIVCVDKSYSSWLDYVASHDGVDHFPVVCKMQWNSAHDSSFCKRRVLPYDRRKIGQPECDLVFNHCISLCPVIPFCIEPSTHAWLVNMCFLNAAMAAYPKDPGNKKHQKYISYDTFRQVQENARILRSITKTNTRMKFASCKVVVNAWKYAVHHRNCSECVARYAPQQKWSDFYSWIPKHLLSASLSLSRRWKVEHVKIKSWMPLEYLAYIDWVTDGINDKT